MAIIYYNIYYPGYWLLPVPNFNVQGKYLHSALMKRDVIL